MSINDPQEWLKHLEELDQHYHPDNFFSDQEIKPSNEPNVREHFFAPALTEETDMPEEAQLSIDIHQDEKNLYVIAPLAGVKPENLELNIDKDILTIKGHREKEFLSEAKNYLYQECYWGQFSRSVILPSEVVEEKVEAVLKHGVLTISLPKKETKKQTKINVIQQD